MPWSRLDRGRCRAGREHDGESTSSERTREPKLPDASVGLRLEMNEQSTRRSERLCALEHIEGKIFCAAEMQKWSVVSADRVGGSRTTGAR